MAEEDAVFAKQMHFYGGVEPGNMRVFDASFIIENGKSKAKITITLPNDTVINDQTLCTVDGAIIRRKEGSVPINEFDGDFFADIKENGVYYDESVEINKTYSYAAFPYTTQGVYNRNPNNVSTVTILNDYPPESLIRFVSSLSFTDDGAFVTLSFVHPGDTKVNGEVVNTLAGIKICRSTTGFPVDETQGELLKDFKIAELSQTGSLYQGSYIDGPLQSNTTYYYSAFPYTTQNIYNRSNVNRTSILVTAGPAPENMSYFTVTPVAIGKNPAMVIDADMSGNELSDAQCTSVSIRRKIDSYPTSIDDGDLVTTFYATDPVHWSGHYRFIDEEVIDGLTYCYRAFPTSPTGSVNVNDVDANKKSVVAKGTWVFACVVIDGVADPYDAVSYVLTDSEKKLLGVDHIDNENFTPAKINWSSQPYSYEPGDWDFIPGTFFMPRPCVVVALNTIEESRFKFLYYLNPNNYSQTDDGTPANITFDPDSTTPETLPQVMVEWRQFYSKSVHDKDAGRKVIAISNKPFQVGDRPVYNFATFQKNMYSDYFYSGAYRSIEYDSQPMSCMYVGSGKIPLYNINKGDIQIVCDTVYNHVGPNTGVSQIKPHWSVVSPMIDYDMYRYLLILMGKTLNLQMAFGYGYIESKKGSIYPGQLNNVGMFGVDQQGEAFKVLGMENLWGGAGEYANGIWWAQRARDISGTGTNYVVCDLIKTYAPWMPDQAFGQGPSTCMGYGFGYVSPEMLTVINSVYAPSQGESSYAEFYGFDEAAKQVYSLTLGNLGNGYVSTLDLASEYSTGDFFEIIPLKGSSYTVNNLKGSSSTYTCDYTGWIPFGQNVGTNNWSDLFEKPQTLSCCVFGLPKGGASSITENFENYGPFSTYYAPAIAAKNGATSCYRMRYIPDQDFKK